MSYFVPRQNKWGRKNVYILIPFELKTPKQFNLATQKSMGIHSKHITGDAIPLIETIKAVTIAKYSSNLKFECILVLCTKHIVAFCLCFSI